MRTTGTKEIRETTIYRILGGGQAQSVEYILRDTFTLTLLAMVLVTNLMIIFIPVSVHLFDVGLAKDFWYTIALSLLPGYAALIYMLISRCKGPAMLSQNLTQIDKGHLTLSKAPRLHNMIIGIQCLLFASLLCSTFIMRQQMNLLNQTDPYKQIEHFSLKSPSTEMPETSLLPLLRQYISM